MERTKWKDLGRILGKASDGKNSITLERNRRGKLCTLRYYRGDEMIYKKTEKEELARELYERAAQRILKSWKRFQRTKCRKRGKRDERID